MALKQNYVHEVLVNPYPANVDYRVSS